MKTERRQVDGHHVIQLDVVALVVFAVASIAGTVIGGVIILLLF
jgi:hypothetical protein